MSRIVRKVWWLPIEPYLGRYTIEMSEWTRQGFDRRGVSYEAICGEELRADGVIRTGVVLDAPNRAVFSLDQMRRLVRLLDAGRVGGNDVILFDDFFTPGFTALP